MKSSTPKVLHTIAGRSLVAHAIAAAADVNPKQTCVVVRHERERVAAHITEVAPQALLADQDEIPGTGRAVQCAIDALGDIAGTVLVASGDVPLLDGATLVELAEAHIADANAATVLTAEVSDATGYGRILRGDDGTITGIVEEADASDEQRAINEINTGIYAFDAAVLRDALGKLGQDNAAGEVYLTDVMAVARDAGGKVRAIITDDPESAEGVNDRVQLAQAAATLNARILEEWMRSGVSIIDPSTTWIDADVQIAQDVTILPGTQLHGTTSVATGAVIGPDSTLTNVSVAENATVTRTHGTDASIAANATVGPFSYLRPGTALGADGKIGAFVETKNAQIGDGSKVPHLSYVGDAEIGEGTSKSDRTTPWWRR